MRYFAKMRPVYTDPLVTWTEKGLYCPSGNFYIDPHRAVDIAVTTHAHSDHARRGSRRYICEKSGVGLLRARVGEKINVHGLAYQERLRMGDVEMSLHSAGHILGSAQVRIQRGEEVWVASGDYKRDPDPSCEPFEVVKCDTFITEATFGTPQYVWPKEARHGEEIFRWWQELQARGANGVLFGYSLGKAQRILAELAPYAEKPVLIHPTIHALAECYRAEGRKLAPTADLPSSVSTSLARGEPFRGELILAPPAVLQGPDARAFGVYETAFASGWMREGGRGHGRRYDRGFIMSDHADWNDLNQTITETGAWRIFVQHRNGALVRHLRAKGLAAHSISELTPTGFARISAPNLELFQ
ncbi:MAG: ligase-associated DNA damage response exonuclease [Bacteriovoracia bacterium]